MSILRKMPWTEAPPFLVPVNPIHPLARGMKLFAQHFGGMPINAVEDVVYASGASRIAIDTDTATNNPQTFHAGPIGRFMRNESVNNERGPVFHFGKNYFSQGSTIEDGITLAAIINPENQNTDVMMSLATGGGTTRFQLQAPEVAVAQRLGVWSSTGGVFTADGGPTLDYSIFQWCMWQFNDTASNTRLFQDRLEVTDAVHTCRYSANDIAKIAFGVDLEYAGQSGKGDYGTVVVWNRMLSEGEWNQFLNNPYAVLQPRTQIIPIEVQISSTNPHGPFGHPLTGAFGGPI